MRTLILGWLGVAAMGWVNRKSSRAKVPNAAATLVLPVDGISDGFPITLSGFRYDHDGRLLLKAEDRDTRGLPATFCCASADCRWKVASFMNRRLISRYSVQQLGFLQPGRADSRVP